MSTDGQVVVPTADGLVFYEHRNGEALDVTPPWGRLFTLARDGRPVCRVCQRIAIDDLEGHAAEHPETQ